MKSTYTRRLVGILVLCALLLTLAASDQSQTELVARAQAFADQVLAAKSEIISGRSRYAQVFQVNGDTRMMELSDQPINYLDEQGQWQAINMQVLASNDPNFGLAATHNDYKAYFSTHFPSPYLVRYEAKGGIIQFGIDDSQPWSAPNAVTGKATGSIVSYDGIYPGVNLRYQLSPSTLLEEFIVTDQARANEISQINKRFSVEGVDWKLESDGSISFTQKGTTEVLWRVPRPVMYELNSPDQANYDIHFEVRAKAGYYQLIKVVEGAGKRWLADPHRQFPVVIDDTILLSDKNQAGGEGSVLSNGTQYQRNTNRTRIVIGQVPNQSYNARAFFEWNTTSIPTNITVQSVGVYMHVQSPYGSGNTVNLVQLGQRISSYPNDTSGNKDLYNQLANAPAYDIALPNFQHAGDVVIPISFDDYTFNSAIPDLQSRIAQQQPFGFGLVGSNEKNASTTILGPADTTNLNDHAALIIFYKGMKGSATSMLRPLRNSFYDGQYYWAFFRTDYAQKYYYSADGATWTLGGELGPSDNQHHGEWYDPNENTVYAAFAVQVTGAFTDMYFRKGTISDSPTPRIVWTDPVPIFQATRNPTTDGYDFPSIVRDTNGNCWILSRHVTETTTGSVVVESTDSTCTAWQTPTVLFQPTANGGDSGVGAYIVPLTNGKLYVVYKDQKSLSGKLYNGTTWASTPTVIDSYTAFGVYSQGLSIVADGDVIHLAYIGGHGGLKYNSWNNGWGKVEILATQGPYWSPSLSLDTSTHKLYLAYRKSGANDKHNGKVYYQIGTRPYAKANWGAPVTVTSTAYSPENIFGAVSPGSVSPWSLVTNYAGNGKNFMIYVDGAYGVQFYSMNP